MSVKNNIRSFRFSDEVLAVLQNYGGDSLNENFEQLVLFCNLRYSEIQKKVELEEERLATLRKQCVEMQNILMNLDTLNRNYEFMKSEISKTERIMADFNKRLSDVTHI